MRRPPPRRGRPQPREHPARAGGLHAQADVDARRPRGGLVDGHRAVRRREELVLNLILTLNLIPNLKLIPNHETWRTTDNATTLFARNGERG